MSDYIRSLWYALWLHSMGVFFEEGRKKIRELAFHLSSSRMRPKIPKISWGALMKESSPFAVLCPDEKRGSVSLKEIVAISFLVRKEKPKFLFEIGTFDGRCSLNLIANASPLARLYTLDLPASEMKNARLKLAPCDLEFIQKPTVGSLLKQDLEEAKRITQLLGDSAALDLRPYFAKMELVLIDGSHSFEYVLQDTQTALRLLRPEGGLIIWCNYSHPEWPDVTHVLDKMFVDDNRFQDIKRVEGTHVVYLHLETVDRSRTTQAL